MSVTPSTGIITPEAVVLEFRAAGLATRAIAKALDLFLQGVLLLVLILAVALPLGGLGDGVAAAIVLALSVFTVLVFVPALCETWWNGKTPGKAIFGLRVVTIQGGPISFRHAFVRGLIQLVELPLGAAVLIALSNPRSQRLGDLAGGTFVVNERSVPGSAVRTESGVVIGSSSVIPTRFVAPPGLEGYVAVLDASRVDSEQFLVVRNFLLRVGELDPAARYALAVRLANELTARCAPAPPPGLQPELYLICVCAAYQARHHRDDPVRPMWSAADRGPVAAR